MRGELVQRGGAGETRRRASSGAAGGEGSSGAARPAASERRAARSTTKLDGGGGEALAAAASFLLGGRWPDGAGAYEPGSRMERRQHGRPLRRKAMGRSLSWTDGSTNHTFGRSRGAFGWSEERSGG